MRVVIDLDLCEAHGLCEATAPEVFDLGDEDTVRVVDEHPAPQHQAAVRAAASSCPRLAIYLEDD